MGDFTIILLASIIVLSGVMAFDYLKQFSYKFGVMKTKKSTIWLLIICLLFVCASFGVFRFGTDFIVKHVVNEGTKGDTFGGTMGPIIAWMAALITFAAFWVQYIANEQQKEVNKKQQDDLKLERFENRFFKFIDYHRDNVNTMKYRDPLRKGEEFVEGNRIFNRVFLEIRNLFKRFDNLSVEKIIKTYKISRVSPAKSNMNLLELTVLLKRINTLRRYNKKIIELPLEEQQHVINFIYNCVFYGAGIIGINIVKTKFQYEYFGLGNFSSRPAEYNEKIKFHGGHVRHLEHYFRNICQAVKYVDEQQFLTAKQKYDYVTILRAQMSSYEQTVLFFNSISDLGEDWELRYFKISQNGKSKKAMLDQLWITKYDLIRNVVNSKGLITNGINIKGYYPLLTLDRQKEFEQTGNLKFLDETIDICRYCYNKKYICYEDENAEMKIRETFPNGLPKIFKCNENPCETKKVI